MKGQTTITAGRPPSSLTYIAHELANSLNAISSTVKLLKKRLKHPQEHAQDLDRESITILTDECRRMENHLEELRRIARQPPAEKPVTGKKEGPL